MDALKRISNMLVGTPAPPAAPIAATAGPHVQGHILPTNSETSEQSIARQIGAKMSGKTSSSKSKASTTTTSSAATSVSTHQSPNSTPPAHQSPNQKPPRPSEMNNPPRMPKYHGLERYRLLNKMGDGAFSTVFRALDLWNQNAEVAVKVVHKRNMSSTQHSNVVKEVQIMRSIRHKNIVRLLDFSESDENYFIVLELCPGGELFHQIVRLTYFSEDLSRHVIVQVAKALQYLHDVAGVVHRDIKPENLLFYPAPFIPTRNPAPPKPGEEDKVDEGEFTPGVGAGGIGVVKVADFGLSKVVWNTSTMTPCGTMGYTAPEIVRDKRYSKSVDMWALGCVLYTLLCGFPPFYDESIQALTEKVAKGQFTFLSPWWDDISPLAKDLVTHLLTVDPDRRYDIRQFLNHPWILNRDVNTIPRQPRDTYVLPSEISIMHDPAIHFGTSKPIDFRSPGVINLREVFDVGYALHLEGEEARILERMEHNAATRPRESDKDFYAASHTSAARAREGNRSEVPSVEQKMRTINLSSAARDRQAAANPRVVPLQTVLEEGGHSQYHEAANTAARMNANQAASGFNLNLHKASLIERRKGRVGQSGLRNEVPAPGI